MLHFKNFVKEEKLILSVCVPEVDDGPLISRSNVSFFFPFTVPPGIVVPLALRATALLLTPSQLIQTDPVVPMVN